VLTLWVLPFGLIGLVILLAVMAFLPFWNRDSAPAPHAHDAGMHGHAHGSHPDFFTNGGHYMERTSCLMTASGEPDWPWIITLVLLNVGIICAYIRIYAFWLRSYLSEAPEDRNGKLMDLAQIFLWCAICGYAAGIVMFVWPAYRLTAICLLILNIWSWRFTFNINSFKAAFSAGRYHRLAHSDALTGLLNRMAIRDEISERLERGVPFAVLFLDFDRFKLVNDSLGHHVGDDLLRAIGGRLREALDDPGIVGAHTGELSRTGGDEFLVIVDDVADAERAVIVGERLLDRFREPFELAGRSIRSVPSIGVTIADDGDRTADDLIRDADIAMYRAKTNGRACVAMFDSDMRSQLEHRLTRENELASAVEDGQMRAYFQPIVDVDSGALYGFEALARWDHPERGVIEPAEFIGIAEEIGLIGEIGQWMLGETARRSVQWRSADPHGRMRFHVNVSADQLRNDEVVDQFVLTVTAAGALPEQIVLEITESLFVGDVGAVADVLAELRAAGFHIAMDDFGTGYSSLASLHRFDIDVLKIDQAFVRNATGRPDHAAVLHAMVSLADNLGVAVVAEGVESADQLAELQAFGCRLSQGFYFARPMPADTVPAWIDHWRSRRAAA
jgi:Amt family ammonium transporter